MSYFHCVLLASRRQEKANLGWGSSQLCLSELWDLSGTLGCIPLFASSCAEQSMLMNNTSRQTGINIFRNRSYADVNVDRN